MKRNKAIITALVALAVLVSMTSCDLIFGSSVGGSAVNVKSSSSASSADQFKGSGGTATLTGATVTLNSLDGSFAYRTEIDGEGNFYFDGVSAGTYTLSGEKTGWAFIPIEVFIGGSFFALPDLLAFESGSGDVTVVLAWQDPDYDLDLIATYGSARSALSNEFTLSAASTDLTVESSGYQLTFDRDANLLNKGTPRVETITINSSGTAIDDSGTPDAGHEIRFYADLYDSEGSGVMTGDHASDISSAYGYMHVMFGDSHYGSWELPLNTVEDTLHVLSAYVYLDTSGFDDVNAFDIYSAGNYAWTGDPILNIAQ